jgi:dimeric dUTPase (all-alpha-NTP-PPase superfamily)
MKSTSKKLDKLDHIFLKQKVYDSRIILEAERDPEKKKKLGVTEEERISHKMTALIHEAVELQRLTNWKWWKAPKAFDKASAKEELIDIMHFVVSAAIDLDMTPQEFFETYVSKNKVNHDRQDQGY